MKTILWDLETFGFDFKADKGFLLCMSYKVLGESKVHTLTRSNLGKDMWDDRELVKKCWEVLSNAERWVTHNGKRFDARFLNVRLLKHGLSLLPQMGKRHVDTCELTWKNLAMGASLKNIERFFSLKAKKTPVNLETWTRAASGNVLALKEVITHCESDVRMLEEYWKMIHPLVTETENPIFHGCDPKFFRHHGTRVADKKIFQRLYCIKCGGWFRGEVLNAPVKV